MPPSDLPDEPILLAVLADADLAAWRGRLGPAVHVGEIDGSSAVTTAAFFEAMAEAFDLPEHFGANWDALHDVMGDLSWLDADGYVVVVHSACSLLSAAEVGTFETFLAVMSSLAGVWAEGGGPGARRRLTFRTVLLAADDAELQSLRSRIGDAAEVALIHA